jgi:hypothetical protein
MRMITGILLFILGVVVTMLLWGCAGEPLTYEQRLAIAQAGSGIAAAGAAYNAGVHTEVQYTTPVYYPPLTIPPAQPFVPIPTRY